MSKRATIVVLTGLIPTTFKTGADTARATGRNTAVGSADSTTAATVLFRFCAGPFDGVLLFAITDFLTAGGFDFATIFLDELIVKFT